MLRGGKSLVSAPPCFSKDATMLLVCTGATVSVFSTSTAMLITELEGHAALVTSVIVVPNPKDVFCYCWTASLDGTIRYWYFAAGTMVKSIEIGLPIFSMVIPGLGGKRKQGDLFAYVTVEITIGGVEKAEVMRGQVRKCNLTEARLGGLVLAETPQPAFLTSSPLGDFFGILKKRTLYMWKAPAKDSDKSVAKNMRLHHTKTFSTFAFHPFDNIVAAGDVSGRILIWRGFGKKTFSALKDVSNGIMISHGGDKPGSNDSTVDHDDKPGVRRNDDAESCSTWHWHSSEVNLLYFSSDGAYLYSGGNEGVLVMWQLDTGKKKFLPRIGSPLLYFILSSDSGLSAISCADNRIVLLNMSSWEILKTVAGIKLPCSIQGTYSGSSSRFVFDRAAGLAAIRTENYCIQFYSVFDDRQISEVQACERNHQPGDDTTVVISLMAVSPDGSMMSTFENKLPEEGIGGLFCLKIWGCESQKKVFKLTTVVYEPHRDAAISALAFNPTRQMLVSCSYGGDFKIWVLSQAVEDSEGALQNSGWKCHAVGSYKGKPMTGASFSADGSVLAVAADTVITLWDPDKNILVAVLGKTCSSIGSLSFVGNSEYLISASHGSRSQLFVWNMETLSVMWSYILHAEAVVCADNDTSFAVLALPPKSPQPVESDGTGVQSTDGVILLFDVGNPVPLATWSVKKATGGRLGFLPANQSSLVDDCGKRPSKLMVFMNGDHEYVVFDPLNKAPKKLELARSDAKGGHEEAGRFGYAALYGDLPAFQPKRDAYVEIPILPSERPWETMFGGSSLALPPLTKLCSAFLESFLEKRTKVSETPPNSEKDTDEELSSD
ncbi:WD repeat-containing protein [Drosera capensis]